MDGRSVCCGDVRCVCVGRLLQVSKLWSSNYDRAMICYLACLKEFGEYAEQQDQRMGGERSFYGFPFAIESDKVWCFCCGDGVMQWEQR